VARTQKRVVNTGVTIITDHDTQKRTKRERKLVGDRAIGKMATLEKRMREAIEAGRSLKGRTSIDREDAAQKGMTMSETTTRGGGGIVLRKAIIGRGERLEISSCLVL
jgi:hypothetical protein